MKSGVFLILLSMSLTPFGDALSKELSGTQSPLFIVFLRYLVAGLMALLLARLSRQKIYLPAPHERAGVMMRTALVIGAMSLLIVALSLVPLASAVGGFLIAPIVATLISVMFFGERLTTLRVLGSAISFCGALLILRPDADFQPGMLFALAGGVMLGAFLVTTRASPTGGNPVSALAVQCLLGALILAPFALPEIGGLTFGLLLPVLGLGFVTGATHFLTVAAYQRAEAAKLAPFFYFNLVAAVIVGVLWFHEIPGLFTLVGLGAIVLGGSAALRARNSLSVVSGSSGGLIGRCDWRGQRIYRIFLRRIGDTTRNLWCTAYVKVTH